MRGKPQHSVTLHPLQVETERFEEADEVNELLGFAVFDLLQQFADPEWFEIIRESIELLLRSHNLEAKLILACAIPQLLTTHKPLIDSTGSDASAVESTDTKATDRKSEDKEAHQKSLIQTIQNGLQDKRKNQGKQLVEKTTRFQPDPEQSKNQQFEILFDNHSVTTSSNTSSMPPSPQPKFKRPLFVPELKNIAEAKSSGWLIGESTSGDYIPEDLRNFEKMRI